MLWLVLNFSLCYTQASVSHKGLFINVSKGEGGVCKKMISDDSGGGGGSAKDDG